MKFLIDAQLPQKLSRKLRELGHNSLHTLDLSAGNKTSDNDILLFAIKENRIVVTKDSDFVVSYHLKGPPPKLLLISTGNISNDQLLRLFIVALSTLEATFNTHSFVELGAMTITIHS